MSHISTIQVEIRGDGLDELAAACRTLGVELRREQKTFKAYGGGKHACEMAIVDATNPQAYEMGLVRSASGTGWTIQMDNYQGGKGMNAKVGVNAGRLLQRYGLNVAASQARKQGMTVRGETVLPDGSIRLVCEPKPQFAQAAAGGAFRGSGF